MKVFQGALGWSQLIKNSGSFNFGGNPAAGIVVLGDTAVGDVIAGDLVFVGGWWDLQPNLGAEANMDISCGNATGTATVVYGTTAVTYSVRLMAGVGNRQFSGPITNIGVCTVGGSWIPRFTSNHSAAGIATSVSARFYTVRGS